jgi:hypothetical protein
MRSVITSRELVGENSKVDAQKAVSRKDAKGGKAAKQHVLQTVHRCDISSLCVFAPFASLREPAFR